MTAEPPTSKEFDSKPQPHPLQIQLDSAQVDLLQLIFFAVTELGGQWPIWDYVSREMSRAEHGDVDAVAILQSLPRVQVSNRPPYAGLYGLFWIQDGFAESEPAADKRIGLTIAGLLAISQLRPAAKVVADGVSSIIGNLARLEHDLPSNPNIPALTQNISMDLVRPFYRFENELQPREFPDEVIFSVLEKEYVTIQVRRGPSTEPVTDLGHWLRPFRQVDNAADYMNIVAREHSTQRPNPRLRADELPLMLDYVSYVLASRDDWEAGHMVRPPDLRTVGSLFTSVSSEAEFHVCMSDFATLMQRLNVPKLPTPAKGSSPGSLVRLQTWLTNHIADETDRADAVEAVEDVRRVVALRVGLQHPAAETMDNTANALAVLKIPYPIRNWGEAWEIIRARVADAFDTVRRHAQP
jgi:hypothetical protein